MVTRKLTVKYCKDGDTLWLHVLPRRRAREAMTEYDFYVRYAAQNQREIVGFKVLDFSHFVLHVHEPGVVPNLEMRFAIEGTDIKNASLEDVLEWAYRKYILEEQRIDPQLFEYRRQFEKPAVLQPA